MNLRIRSIEPELMDLENDDKKIRNALRGLKIINRFLGGNSVTKKGIIDMVGKNKLKIVKILDAGGGNSDVLSQKFPFNVSICSLDKNKVICMEAKAGNKNKNIICGDIIDSPLKRKSFDIVHASLFFHHFNSDKLPGVLNEFICSARYGVLINDLRRSWFAYYGFRILSIIIPGGIMVRHDGLISVKRGFKENELKNLLDRCGYKYKLERKWIFRWLILIYSNESI
jgi:hypothetical protein